MKREIICKNCEPDYRQLFPVESPYPGEYIKFVNGKARENMTCDFCGTPIKKNKSCCAVSMYTDQIPYFEWEDEDIKTTGK